MELKEIKSVQLLNDDISAGKLVVDFRVVNPNNYPIKVKKYDIHAYVNDTDLGIVEAVEEITLPKNSDQDYQLTFTPDKAKILGLLPALLLMGSAEVSLKGNVKVGTSFLSKSFPVDIKRRVSAADFR